MKTTQSTIRQKTFENNEQLEWLHLGIISTKNLSKLLQGSTNVRTHSTSLLIRKENLGKLRICRAKYRKNFERS